MCLLILPYGFSSPQIKSTDVVVALAAFFSLGHDRKILESLFKPSIDVGLLRRAILQSEGILIVRIASRIAMSIQTSQNRDQNHRNPHAKKPELLSLADSQTPVARTKLPLSPGKST